MNKKGFTLIEMLVVIAIIAVLVAIVIPVVGSSTDKAGAATNAANLRAVYAELQTELLAKNVNTDGYIEVKADGSVALTAKAPKAAKTIGCDKDTAMKLENGVVSYNGMTIEYFAEIAETGSAPSTTTTTGAAG